MILVLVLPVSSFPDQLSREELYQQYSQFPVYAQRGFVQPIWLSDGNRFCYARVLASGRQFFLVDPVNNTQEPFFDVPPLRTALAVLGDNLPEGVPFEEFVFVQDDQAIEFNWNGTRFLLGLEKYSLERLPPETPKLKRRNILGKQNWPTTEELSSDGEWYLGVEDFNLYMRSTRDGQVRTVTSDGVEDFEWEHIGFPGPSVLTSPDGNLLAARKTDYRNTPKIPLVDSLDPKHSTQWIPYPTGFDRRPTYHLYLIDPSSGKLISVEGAHRPEHWLLMLQWSLDSRHLYFVRMDRYFKKLELMVADASTGASRVILTEEADTSYLNEHPERDTLFTLLEDGERFVWLSERDGWRNLYLYNVDGRMLTQLTRGKSPVVRVVEVDEEREWIYFSAHGDPERTADTHLYRVNLRGRQLAQLTEAPGQHDPRGYFRQGNYPHQIRFSPSQQYFLDTHSTPARPPTVEVRKADGTRVRTLAVAELPFPVAWKWRPPEVFSATAADGATPLEGVLYLPSDFDPSKRYPVIAFICSLAGAVPRTFDSNGPGVNAQALAQLGFITLVLGRGTHYVDQTFRDASYGYIGKLEVQDHVAALKQLATTRPYLDLDRVGVFGGSYGGYMAIHAVLTEPDMFKVAVAVAPITDMGRHDGNEAYLGPLESNPQAYEYSSNIRLAGDLEGKLLLIHGTHDTAVPLSHTLRMVDALIEADKPFDLMIMPGETHGTQEIWSGYGNRAAIRYFIDHL